MVPDADGSNQKGLRVIRLGLGLGLGCRVLGRVLGRVSPSLIYALSWVGTFLSWVGIHDNSYYF